MDTPTYADWKAAREYDRSFDRYKFEFPEAKEYQVFRLDPNTKMSHIEGAPLLETNDQSEAHSFIYDAFKNEGLELCIFQPRNQGYVGYYRKMPHDGQPRAKNGRFGKRV